MASDGLSYLRGGVLWAVTQQMWRVMGYHTEDSGWGLFWEGLLEEETSISVLKDK